MLGTAVTQLTPADTSDPARDLARGDWERYALAVRLLDTLIHDARNPLNALSINIEVLAEKVRLHSGGTLPPSQEKNFKAMRDQIQRIDGILRLYSPHIAQEEGIRTTVDMSDLVMKAAEVLAHESRRARVRLLVEATPGATVRAHDLSTLRFVITRTILLGLEGCSPGAELRARVGCERGQAVLRVGGGAPSGSKTLDAIGTFVARLGGTWSVSARELSLSLPLL